MTHTDPILGLLSELRTQSPQSGRAERVRAKCEAVLARRQRSLHHRKRIRLSVEPLLVGLFSVAYAIVVILALVRH